MKRILPFFLCLLFSIILQAQSIEELKAAWENATQSEEKLTYGERLAEKLLTKNPEEAFQYVSEAYQLAEQIKSTRHLATTAYLKGKIEVRRRKRGEAIEHFKTAFAFAKRMDDVSFAYRAIRKLVYLFKKEGKYKLALSFAEEGMELLKDAKHLDPQEEAISPPMAIEEDPELQNEIVDLQKEKDRLQEEIASLMFEREEQLSFDLSGKSQKTAVQQYTSNTDNMAQQELYIWAAAFVSIVLLAFGFLRFREIKKAKHLVDEKNKIIAAEQKKAEELLLNIVPATIAQEIKEHKKTIAKKYEFTSVLFADFKNFAKVSKQLEPQQLVKALDHCFKAFDAIIARYDNIEKIKTIGDTYLCATGLTTRETAPVNLVQAALEMQDFLNEYKKEKMARSEPFFEARIGIHTGEVVAGVVGAKKFAYDIFGETVDIAASIQQHCEEGKVNLSVATYRLIKYSFDCVRSGAVPLENGREIEMYYVSPEQDEVMKEEEAMEADV